MHESILMAANAPEQHLTVAAGYFPESATNSINSHSITAPFPETVVDSKLQVPMNDMTAAHWSYRPIAKRACVTAKKDHDGKTL